MSPKSVCGARSGDDEDDDSDDDRKTFDGHLRHFYFLAAMSAFPRTVVSISVLACVQL